MIPERAKQIADGVYTGSAARGRLDLAVATTMAARA